MTNRSKWPVWTQKIVKYLARVVTKEDVDQLRSANIGATLKLQELWATGVRVWRRFGHTKNGKPKSYVEWVQLQQALNGVKTVDPEEQPPKEFQLNTRRT
jgi:hypothetical protein